MATKIELMTSGVRRTLLLVLACAAVAAGDDRLAVLEFFGRTGCGNCNAAGHVVEGLQRELAGRTVLLEYDYDLFSVGRQDRFWATGVAADYLPLVMVGSGYRTSSGWVEFDPVYRTMVADELARPPRAAMTAYWRRAGDALRAYVDITNLGPTDFRVSREAEIWVIAYEDAPIGITETWVR
jgi:thiol-disulfide isomerase/thioredoxin